MPPLQLECAEQSHRNEREIRLSRRSIHVATKTNEIENENAPTKHNINMRQKNICINFEVGVYINHVTSVEIITISRAFKAMYYVITYSCFSVHYLHSEFASTMV